MRGYPITIVTYHSVCSPTDEYTITPETFRRQISTIRRLHRIVRLDELPGMLARGKGPAQRLVVITFDDALVDFYEHALPVLTDLDVPSTVFAPTGHIGNHNSWDAQRVGYVRKPIMTWQQIRDVQSIGIVDIGSHGVDHLRLGHLPRQEADRQVKESKRVLEDHLGVAISMFAYPYGQLGDFGKQDEQTLAASGYSLAVTTHWGTRQSWERPFRLRRIFFENSDTDRAIERKLKGRHDWRSWKERIGFLLRRTGVRGGPDKAARMSP